jgi:hypothetical protein
MRVRVLLLVVIMVVAGGYAFVRFRSATHTAASPLREPMSGSVPARIDFTTQVRPILDRCQPCHFSGGTMYEKLPFDRPETVTKLGEKLFTRIQSDSERKIIREFIAQTEADKL